MYTGRCLSPEHSDIIGKNRDYNDYCCLWTYNKNGVSVSDGESRVSDFITVVGLNVVYRS